jgi:hypothetical protein
MRGTISRHLPSKFNTNVAGTLGVANVSGTLPVPSEYVVKDYNNPMQERKNADI